MSSVQPFGLKLLLIPICFACLVWYLFVSVKMSIAEMFFATTGLIALWLPISLAVFLWTRDQIDNVLSRFTFSVISSYALTTALYFAFGVANLWLPGIERGFPILLTLVVIISGIVAGRAGYLRTPGFDKVPTAILSLDWILILLLMMSSFVTLRYKSLFEFDPLRQIYQLTNCADQTYFTSVAYECLKNTPMTQTPYRAGKASRAYHMFPHLTTALIGRFSSQPDLLRAHLIYEYTFIEWLMLLSLFSIARQMTGSRRAGYLAILLFFIGAVPTARLYENGAKSCFYFCIWPQSTSMIEPVLITSPQQYSGSLITYGIILGMSSITSRILRNERADRIAFIVAVMSAIMVRVRIQTFLPLFPCILIILGYLLYRTRDKRYVTAAAAAVVVAMGLILEMQSTVYVPSTSGLVFGLNRIGVTIAFLNSWPGSNSWASCLMLFFPRDSTIFAWIWQFTSLAMFTLLNIIGVPFLVTTNFYLRHRRSGPRIDPASFLMCWLAAVSYLGSMFLAANYDNWSVGGQMLLHINWYLYPISVAGLWMMMKRASARFNLSSTAGNVLLFMLAGLGLAWHGIRPPSLLQKELLLDRMVLQPDQLEALDYVRTKLPETAVILSQPTICRGSCAFSGVSGRRAYFEYFPSIERRIDSGPDGELAREERVAQLWATDKEEEFCRLIPDVVTHIVEFLNNPLNVVPSDCLEVEWISSHENARILKVKNRIRTDASANEGGREFGHHPSHQAPGDGE